MTHPRLFHARRGRLAAAVALCAALVACAHAPLPEQQLGASQASVQAALAAGANDATPEMALAREKLAAAEAAARDRKPVQARRLAEEAEVDALVARSRVAADDARKAASEVDAGLATLGQELGQNPATGAPTRATTSPVRP